MKNSPAFAFTILVAFAAMRCSDLGPNSPDLSRPQLPPLTPLQKAVVTSSNSFGMNLFKRLDNDARGRNVFISPLSVSVALGMTLNGAKGSTFDAMQQTMGFTGLRQDDINATFAVLISGLTSLDPTVEMQIANSIWYKPILNVEQSFKVVNTTYFNAAIRSVDFSDPSTVNVINGWVNDNTHGKIPTIVDPPIPDDMVMYLINAVYFKGTWARRFDTSGTYDGMFTTSGGSTMPCRMMNAVDSLAYLTEGGMKGVDLLYGNAGFSMTILLPPEGIDIDDFIAGITSEAWDNWTNRFVPTKVNLHMPKFKLTYDAFLNEPLANLGMGIAFTDQADFTGIDKRGSLAISEVRHKTFLQVDEAGTEAAAVTSVGMRATSIGGGLPRIVLNRPFLFVIREHTSGAILFIGKLAQPGN